MANNDLLAEDNVYSTDINIEEKDEQGWNYRNNMRKTNREKEQKSEKNREKINLKHREKEKREKGKITEG